MFIVYLIVGSIGGVLGGMGMGGGTLLIPLLTIFCGVEQRIAQAINLISFIPMAVVSLIIHFKNKLINKKGVLIAVIPGCVGCVLGALISKSVSSDHLGRFFGGFLVILSIFQVLSIVKNRQ